MFTWQVTGETAVRLTLGYDTPGREGWLLSGLTGLGRFATKGWPELTGPFPQPLWRGWGMVL